MKKSLRIILVAMLLLFPVVAVAASFTVSAPRQVIKGRQFQVTYTLENAEGSNIKAADIPGVTVCNSPEKAAQLAKTAQRAFVIGGGSVYRQMLSLCDRAYVTKVHALPKSDTWFPNLDEEPDWVQTQVLQSGVENGIAYEMCLYEKC